MVSENNQTHEIWHALAELFFLDTEHEKFEYIHVSKLLKDAGWNRAHTENTLVELIAPVAASNLGGYFFFPVVGEWAGFDKPQIVRLVTAREELRKRRPKWMFGFADWRSRRMMEKLEWEKLLDLLQ